MIHTMSHRQSSDVIEHSKCTNEKSIFVYAAILGDSSSSVNIARMKKTDTTFHRLCLP
jgi:hypothetical protein